MKMSTWRSRLHIYMTHSNQYLHKLQQECMESTRCRMMLNCLHVDFEETDDKNEKDDDDIKGITIPQCSFVLEKKGV